MQTYPQLATYTLFGDTYVIGGAANFNDKGTKICQAIYTTEQLSDQQIQSLTDDMNAQLGPALIAMYAS